jgi:hypothetical protein
MMMSFAEGDNKKQNEPRGGALGSANAKSIPTHKRYEFAGEAVDGVS